MYVLRASVQARRAVVVVVVVVMMMLLRKPFFYFCVCVRCDRRHHFNEQKATLPIDEVDSLCKFDKNCHLELKY